MTVSSTGSGGIRTGLVRVNGLEVTTLELGRGPLVLCLHGFPDSAWGYAPLMRGLAERGYRVVAPFNRGYPPSAPAPDGDYSVLALADDALALASALGADRFRLVGHDWGALAAMAAAAIAPQRIERLVVAGMWHLGGLRLTWGQLRRSWYIGLFQLPALPERVVARNDFAFVDRLYRDWSPHWRFTAEDTAAAKDCLRRPGALAAALAYYRHNLLRMTPLQRRLLRAPTTVPSLLLYGAEDGCIDAAAVHRSSVAFEDLRRVVEVPGAGHFPHREFAQHCSDEIGAFLA
jgi:pimeloyl-ACP methyl ester carboxylesterase